jgi:hypothetical protein
MSNMKYLFFFITLLAGCFSKDPIKTGLEGKTLPDFSLLKHDSSAYFSTTLISKETPFVLMYFSPHCLYCKAMTKDILSNINTVSKIQFYFVSSSPIAEIKRFDSTYKLYRHPNIFIGKDTAYKMAHYFGLSGVPFVAIYGKGKILKNSFRGKISISQLKDELQE